MKALKIFILFLLSVWGCADVLGQITLSGLNISDFNKDVDGKPVRLFVLRNKSGMEACITNYGGRLVSLMVPDRNGKPTDVVLGFDNIDDYLNSFSYFGALIGRYANRIANAEFVLLGNEYKLSVPFGGHCLHGGLKGFHNCIWNVTQLNGQTLELEYLSPDGESGFPGELSIRVTYSITDSNALDIKYEAVTDKPTVVNFTNHSYFNLSGKPESNVLDHIVQINADAFTPLDDSFIPTGEIQPVKGTPMNFNEPVAIGTHIDDEFPQIRKCKGFDHNWILNTNGDTATLAARAFSEDSGILMEVYTNEPAIQFYTNMGASKTKGKHGAKYPARAAFCMETQHYPNAPNTPNFPSTVLYPGDSYLSRCIYMFSVKQ